LERTAGQRLVIHRFFDPEFRFIWNKEPGDCPQDAVGFDFDESAFSHVGVKVTF
jgi:hypothetical protein